MLFWVFKSNLYQLEVKEQGTALWHMIKLKLTDRERSL